MSKFFQVLWASIVGAKNGEATDQSDRGKVDTVDIAKVVRTSLVVGVAAVLTHVLETLQVVDVQNEAVIVILVTAALDFVKRFVKKNPVQNKEA